MFCYGSLWKLIQVYVYVTMREKNVSIHACHTWGKYVFQEVGNTETEVEAIIRQCGWKGELDTDSPDAPNLEHF